MPVSSALRIISYLLNAIFDNGMEREGGLNCLEPKTFLYVVMEQICVVILLELVWLV